MFRKLAALAAITSSVIIGGGAIAHEKATPHTHTDVIEAKAPSSIFNYSNLWEKVSAFDFSGLFK